MLLVCVFFVPETARRIMKSNPDFKETTIAIVGNEIGAAAAFDHHLRIEISHPATVSSGESCAITLIANHSIETEGWRDYEVTVSLDAASFDVKPDAPIKRTITNGTTNRWTWTATPRSDKLRKQTLVLRCNGFSFQPFFDTDIRPFRRTFRVSRNDVEIKDYPGIIEGEIPLEIVVYSQFGVPVQVVWIAQAILALVGFLFAYPVIIGWIKKSTQKEKARIIVPE